MKLCWVPIAALCAWLFAARGALAEDEAAAPEAEQNQDELGAATSEPDAPSDAEPSEDSSSTPPSDEPTPSDTSAPESPPAEVEAEDLAEPEPANTTRAPNSAHNEAASSDEEAEGDDDTDDAAQAGPFSRGSVGLSILVGGAAIGERDYLVTGAGVRYFLVDGLSLGADGDVWLLEDPFVGTLRPELRYVFHMVPVIKPYVGVFYRHYFVADEFDDLDSLGGRVGAFLVSGSGSYLGVGAIYEKFLTCNETYWECSGWYPELTVGISL